MIPEPVRRLALERQAARADRRFAEADRLRERIHAAGFEVLDTPAGFELRPAAPPAEPAAFPSSRHVPSVLEEPPTCDVSVQWVVQGWPEDVERGIASFDAHPAGAHSVRHLVVEAGEGGGEWPAGVEVIRVRPEIGWSAARNAGLVRSAGRVVVLVDGSVEASGDVLSPLLEALHDPTVGVAGPFGLLTPDLRDFHESPGPEVDAVEGYLMAFRRDLLAAGVRFDEGFRFYRSADIELSFQIKALGYRALVVPAPVRRHEHRMWTNTAEGRRAQLSKRNFYRFLDRWRGRSDLTVGGAGLPP